MFENVHFTSESDKIVEVWLIADYKEGVNLFIKRLTSKDWSKMYFMRGGGKVTMESDEISSNSEILSWHITFLNLYCTVYTLYFCVHSPFSPSLINCLFTNIIQSSVRRRRERKEKVWRFYVLCIISITRIPSCLFLYKLP